MGGISQKKFHVLIAITDNANNIVAAVKITGWPHLPCFAHTINLIVTNSISEVQELEEIIHVKTWLATFTKVAKLLTNCKQFKLD